MTCTLVVAGRGAPPVRKCVLFLEAGVTGRLHGPVQSESLGLRQPGLRLERQSQPGPECLREQLQFVQCALKRGRPLIPKNTAETVLIACSKTQHAF